LKLNWHQEQILKPPENGGFFIFANRLLTQVPR